MFGISTGSEQCETGPDVRVRVVGVESVSRRAVAAMQDTAFRNLNDVQFYSLNQGVLELELEMTATAPAVVSTAEAWSACVACVAQTCELRS